MVPAGSRDQDRHSNPRHHAYSREEAFEPRHGVLLALWQHVQRLGQLETGIHSPKEVPEEHRRGIHLPGAGRFT